jgi:hypothetical protein
MPRCGADVIAFLAARQSLFSAALNAVSRLILVNLQGIGACHVRAIACRDRRRRLRAATSSREHRKSIGTTDELR